MLACLTLALGFVLFGDPASGPAVGDKLGDVKVKGAFEPIEGKELNLLDNAKKGPTVLIFVHKITRPTFRLLKEIDKTSAKHETLKTTFIWLTDDLDKTQGWLNNAKNSLNFQSPVAISLDGTAGPNGYGLNDMAGVTIVLANDGVVTATFAYADPNETVAPKVVGAIEKLVR